MHEHWKGILDVKNYTPLSHKYSHDSKGCKEFPFMFTTNIDPINIIYKGATLHESDGL
jgi:hypothetical protein